MMADKHYDRNGDRGKTPPGIVTEPALTALAFDLQDFAQEIGDMAIDPKQAEALLENLWHIMAGFVDLGWGVDSMQIVLPELFGQVAQGSTQCIESKGAEKKGGHHD